MAFYEISHDRFSSPTCFISEHKGRVDTHFHYCMELMYIIDGELHVEAEKSVYSLTPGKLIIISSGTSHATVGDGSCRYYLCYVPKYLLLPAIQLRASGISSHAVLADDGERSLFHLFKCMADNSNHRVITPSTDTQTYVTSMANAIISLLLPRLQTSDFKPRSEDRMLQIIHYIHENYSDSALTTQYIAEKFGYTPRMLSDVFKDNLRVGVKRYIDMLRINEAKYQLLSTSDNIEVISSEVGFDSLRSFYRIFKLLTGETPTSYRK